MCVFKEDEMQAVVEKERGRTLASWICFYSWCKASIYCCCLWSSGRSLSSKLEQKWLQQWGMQFLFRALVSVPPGSWAASWRPPVSFGGACCCTDLRAPLASPPSLYRRDVESWTKTSDAVSSQPLALNCREIASSWSTVPCWVFVLQAVVGCVGHQAKRLLL